MEVICDNIMIIGEGLVMGIVWCVRVRSGVGWTFMKVCKLVMCIVGFIV